MLWLAGVLDLVDELGNGLGQLVDLGLAGAANVEDQPGVAGGLDLHGQAGKLLKSLDGVRVGDKVQVGVFSCGHGQVGASLADVDVNIAIQISYVK